MMDQKSWLWPKKRSSEKTIRKSDHPTQGNVMEGQTVPNEKEIFLEESLKILDEKLAAALSDSNFKDEQLIKSAEMEQEAIAGRKKAEAEVVCLKKELDESVHQREAANERIMHLNTALKDHMQLLTSLREEQEQKVRDAVMRTAKDFEKAHRMLEDGLTETTKRIANLTSENSHLNKVLLVNAKIIEDLTKSSTHAEAEFNALMSRLDSVEKENSFLRYEYQMLEREFQIQNEEVELSRRSLDTSHKHQLENVKKIKKLEGECQRLRVLTRKRLPSKLALVEMQEQNQAVVRRRKSDTTAEFHPDTLRKEISLLVECMRNMEGENRALKDVLARKEIETSSISSYDTCKRDESVCSIENFKPGRASEMSLMDDFVEMEKLAIVAVDSTIGSSYPPSDASLSDSSRIETHGKELVQVGDSDSNEQESVSNWINEILKIIMEQSSVSKKGVYELIEDIRVALYNVNPPCTGAGSGQSELLPVTGFIAWKSPVTSPRLGTIEENEGLKAEVNSVKMHIVRNKSENLANELEQSQQRIESLEAELETSKESRRMMEDLLENQKSINEDIDTQLSVTKVKLNETFQKLSSLEVELEDRSHCCEELEGTCLELQLQLESISATKTSADNVDHEKGLQQTGWEMTSATAKLAECQETILNLGKQIKALALPKENTVDDTNCSSKNLKKHMSLLDRMLTEDDVDSPNSKQPLSFIDTLLATQGPQGEAKTSDMGTLVILPSKKRGGIQFLTKLLLRKKRGRNKKRAFSLGIDT